MKESINIKQILISVLFTWFGLKCVTFKNTMLFIWTDVHSNNDKWFFFLVGVYLDKAPWIIYRIFYEPPTVRSFVGFKKFVYFFLTAIYQRFLKSGILSYVCIYIVQNRIWILTDVLFSSFKNQERSWRKNCSYDLELAFFFFFFWVVEKQWQVKLVKFPVMIVVFRRQKFAFSTDDGHQMFCEKDSFVKDGIAWNNSKSC